MQLNSSNAIFLRKDFADFVIIIFLLSSVLKIYLKVLSLKTKIENKVMNLILEKLWIKLGSLRVHNVDRFAL